MFACSNSVCACRKLSTFRYHLLFCCWFLIFDINCGVCWKDKFLLKTVLNIVDSSTPRSRAGTFYLFGSWESVKCLFAWFYVSWPDFEFWSCFYIKHFVWSKAPWNKKEWNQTASSLLKDLSVGMQLLICWITVWEGCWVHCSEACSAPQKRLREDLFVQLLFDHWWYICGLVFCGHYQSSCFCVCLF